MTIGEIDLPNPVFLAPMAGYTNLPFRLLAKQYGAGAVFTEMISAKGLHYKDKKTATLMMTDASEAPAGIQLFGSEPEMIAEVVAEVINPSPFAFVDFNAGCPAPKIVKNGDGSALMKNPVLLGKIVAAIKKVSTKPLLVKTRLGWDTGSVNIEEIAAVIAENGADAHTIHGRTRDMFYSGKADWERIGRIKRQSAIPIIASGDVVDGASAKRLFEMTGCDAIMIGRAALGNPFIFEEIRCALNGQPWTPPSPKCRLETALIHADMLEKISGCAGIREMRGHLVAYTKGLKNAAALRPKIFAAEDRESLARLFDEYLDVYA